MGVGAKAVGAGVGTGGVQVRAGKAPGAPLGLGGTDLGPERREPPPRKLLELCGPTW